MFLAVEFIIVEVVGIRDPIARFTNPTFSVIVHIYSTQLVVRSHSVTLRGLYVYRECVRGSITLLQSGKAQGRPCKGGKVNCPPCVIKPHGMRECGENGSVAP